MKMVFTAEMDTEDFIAAVKELKDNNDANDDPKNYTAFMVERGMEIKLRKLSFGLMYDITARKEIKEAIAEVNDVVVPMAIKMASKDGVSD